LCTNEEDPEPVIEFGKLSIHISSHRVLRRGRPVTLSAMEFRLLVFLASHPNRLFSRDRLLHAVWGAHYFVTPRIIDVYIRRLREKIETNPEAPSYLKTIRGVGYLFETGNAASPSSRLVSD
jgi:two-component system phosphate regulon response regulator PhoB